MITDEMVSLIKTKCANKHSMAEVAKTLGVNPRTLTKYMQKSGSSEIIYSNTLNNSSMFHLQKYSSSKHFTENHAT